ncbi:hypothetical protein ZWY2020_036131 [Hordeum vulgare]|nr:hypothetical protein ZWY2020_036131 [Hordeum vulgare]
MREVQRSPDPRQRARWWMYLSSEMTLPQPDPTRLASRTEGVTDIVPAIPAPVNTTYWDHKNPTVIFPYNYDPDSKPSSGDKEVGVILSDDETEVHMVAPVLVAKEGDQDLPIVVDELPEMPVPSAVIKQEVVDANAEGGKEQGDKKNKTRAKKKTVALEVVRRSERLKVLKKN